MLFLAERPMQLKTIWLVCLLTTLSWSACGVQPEPSSLQTQSEAAETSNQTEGITLRVATQCH